MAVPERPVLVAPDSFKGTFSAAQVAGAIGRGIERAGLMPPDLCPVADGGEGTLDALLPQLGGELRAVTVRGPLGAPVQHRLRPRRGRRDGDRRDGDGLRARADRRKGRVEREHVRHRRADRGRRAGGRRGDPRRRRRLGHDRRRRGRDRGDRGRRRHRPREDRRAVRRAHAVRGRAEGLRPAEGRRRGHDHAPGSPPGRARADTAEGPARRSHDRRGGRPRRRLVGAVRREARGRRAVRARRARLRRAHAGGASRRHRRGQARRADAAGQARGRDRHPHPPGAASRCTRSSAPTGSTASASA